MANAAVGAITAAMSAPVATCLAVPGAAAGLTGPVGCLVLGAAENQQIGVATFDCWKPVLHDVSVEPSRGILLQNVVNDPRVKEVTATMGNEAALPQLFLTNIWGEKFVVQFVHVFGEMYAHAAKV